MQFSITKTNNTAIAFWISIVELVLVQYLCKLSPTHQLLERSELLFWLYSLWRYLAQRSNRWSLVLCKLTSALWCLIINMCLLKLVVYWFRKLRLNGWYNQDCSFWDREHESFMRFSCQDILSWVQRRRKPK